MTTHNVSAVQNSNISIPPNPSPWKHFVSGNIGGIFGLTLCYPLDTVKVRLQTRTTAEYKGITDCFFKMVKNEGINSLYRGLASPVIGYGLIKSTAFGSYNYAKSKFKNNTIQSKLSLVDLFLCGGFAGASQTLVRCPIEQIKVVMQSRVKNGKSPYNSTFSCLTDVLKTEGIYQGLYRSLIPTLAREIPQYAIYYPTYEIFKHLFASSSTDSSKRSTSILGMLCAGGLAGIAQWLPTYGLDVVKSKISAAEPGTYKGLWDCTFRIYRNEGITVFFRGISAALLRAFPLHGCVFLGYELSMKMLG